MVMKAINHGMHSKINFPGVTLDWSDALRTSFNEVLFEHATNTLGQLSTEGRHTFILKEM